MRKLLIQVNLKKKMMTVRKNWMMIIVNNHLRVPIYLRRKRAKASKKGMPTNMRVGKMKMILLMMTMMMIRKVKIHKKRLKLSLKVM